MLQRSPFLAIYMLSYMEILTCFVWCLLILFYYVIKMEIKQHKRFFFCLYFNPVLSRNSFTTSVLQMYIVGNLVQWNSTCILYFGYVTFWLCRTSDNSKYFLHSLGLWDNEVDLYIFWYVEVDMLKRFCLILFELWQIDSISNIKNLVKMDRFQFIYCSL